MSRKSRGKLQFNIHLLEVVWTLVPALILVLTAVPSIKALYFIESELVTPLRLKVVGNQWYWSYEFFGQEVNEAYLFKEEGKTRGIYRLLDTDFQVSLPYGVPIQVFVTSRDVIHSWAVPAAGLRLDAIPGRINHVGVVFERPGVVYGQCSEICGANHSFIPITLALRSML